MKLLSLTIMLLLSVIAVQNTLANPSFNPKPKTSLELKHKLKLKPNLQVHSIGWRGEFCNTTPCSKELKNLRINKATCWLSVRIVNNGIAHAGAFRVKLNYTSWDGRAITRFVAVSGMRSGGFAKSKLIYFKNIGYYRINRPFTVKVDALNQVAETNESDNVKSKTFNF